MPKKINRKENPFTSRVISTANIPRLAPFPWPFQKAPLPLLFHTGARVRRRFSLILYREEGVSCSLHTLAVIPISPRTARYSSIRRFRSFNARQTSGPLLSARYALMCAVRSVRRVLMEARMFLREPEFCGADCGFIVPAHGGAVFYCCR